MKFMLTIDCDNAAFDSENGDLLGELARILRVAADNVGAGLYDDRLRDINGNRVGAHTLIGDATLRQRGELLATVLNLHPHSRVIGDARYTTQWGDKTHEGLFRTIERILIEGD